MAKEKSSLYTALPEEPKGGYQYPGKDEDQGCIPIQKRLILLLHMYEDSH